MTPAEQKRVGQHVRDIVCEHLEGIMAEMRRRGVITPEMWEAMVEGALTTLYYVLEHRVLWTEVRPREIRRQRRQSTRPPIVRTGVLCDREGRELCTVSQDATGEYRVLENIGNYLYQVFKAYPVFPKGYEQPERRK
jgi:hypothetical protein